MRWSCVVLVTAAALAGCGARTVSNTPRTAIEQLLLSGAVDLALEKIELSEAKGKKLYVDFSNLKAYDAEYIKVACRARFARLGAVLVAKADEADYTAEIASGGLGIEYKSSLVGLPAIPIPQAPIPMPELAAYKSIEQTGILKLLVFVHARGKFVAADRYYAKCDRDEGFLLWWRLQRVDQIREGWLRADNRLKTVKESSGPKAK